MKLWRTSIPMKLHLGLKQQHKGQAPAQAALTLLEAHWSIPWIALALRLSRQRVMELIGEAIVLRCPEYERMSHAQISHQCSLLPPSRLMRCIGAYLRSKNGIVDCRFS